jgi:hypothetical protein
VAYCFPRARPDREAIAYGNRGYAYHRKRDMTRAVADYTMEIKAQA